MTHLTDEGYQDNDCEHNNTIKPRLWTGCACLKLRTGNSPSPRKPLYTPLPNPDSIRLLKIHPGKPGQEITCTLHLACLSDDLPHYEALSYVWITRPGEKSITCDGYKKDVPVNLHDALEQLRYPRQHRVVWVDKLCINQSDLKEKNEQVRKMHHVYRSGTRVIVWLGIDDGDTARPAFAILCTIVNAHRNNTTPVSYTIIRKHHSYSVPCIHSPPALGSKEWATVLMLFINKWWLRMWVLQEIVLAPAATIVWGSAELDWQVVCDAIDVIRTQPHLHNLLENRAFQNAYIMNHLGKLPLDKLRHTHPFLHLLDLSRSFDVTHPKDKIYGLLGFRTGAMEGSAGSTDPSFVLPDYDSSVNEVYTYIARKMLLEQQNLDVLSFTTHIEPDFTKELQLPSWVPDWNSKAVIYPFMGFGSKNQHRAGLFKEMEILQSQNTDVLCLKGVMVDVVFDKSPSTPHSDLYDSTPDLKRLLEWCKKSRATVSTVAATLTAGRNNDGVFITNEEQHLADFCAFLLNMDPMYLRSTWSEDADTLSDLARKVGNPDRARETLWRFSCYRSAFTTESGSLGFGPGAVQTGDVIVVLWGGQVPYVLREEEKGWFQFVGECFTEGFMDGEVADKLDAEHGYVERTFEMR